MLLLSFTAFSLFAQPDLAQYVNAFIGAGGHGQTFAVTANGNSDKNIYIQNTTLN